MLPCKYSNIVASDGISSLSKLNLFALILKRQSNPLAVAGVDDCRGEGRRLECVPRLIRRYQGV